MLGIIIGVAAVIAVVSIGNGAKTQIETAIASLGQNVIQVMSGNSRRGGVSLGFGSAGTLTKEDFDAIRKEVPGISGISPEVRSSSQVAVGNKNAPRFRDGCGSRLCQHPRLEIEKRRKLHRRRCATSEQGLRSSGKPPPRPSSRKMPIRSVRSFALATRLTPSWGLLAPKRHEHVRQRSGRRDHHALHQRDENGFPAEPPSGHSSFKHPTHRRCNRPRPSSTISSVNAIAPRKKPMTFWFARSRKSANLPRQIQKR